MIDKKLLKNGHIILFHTKGFSPFSWGIRALTQSHWNHCGLYVDGHVIEALGKGVVKNPIDNYIGNKRYDLKIVALRPEAFMGTEEYNLGIEKAVAYVQKMVGVKYDWGAIIFLGLKYILKGCKKKFPIANNLFQSREKFFCSELICTACYNISSMIPYLFQGRTKQKCDTTTPRDIAKSENVYFVAGVDKI